MTINKVGSKGIEDGAVATADLQDNVVTSAKLGDGEVTNAKLANTTVTLAGQSITLGASGTLANKFVDWQTVITAAGSSNTAVSGQGYFIDTTSAVHTVTLPASASRGDFIAIKDYAGTFATNNLTVGRNGHNIQGVANDSLISTNRASVIIVYVDSTKGWLYTDEHNAGDLQNLGFISATGGTTTTSGDYKIHTFTGDGCFVVSCVGFPSPLGLDKVDYIVVAGGGGGGGRAASPAERVGAGGGAGGYRESKDSGMCSPHTASPLAATTGLTVTSATYPITVGGGGSGGTDSASGGKGSNSVFSTITSTGGGPGGQGCGQSGGSGGGAGADCSGNTIGAGNTPPVSPPQGNSGGPNGGTTGSAGGGGGATTAGSAASGGWPGSGNGGNGGTGATSSINGTPTARADGGGGGGENSRGSPGPGNTGGYGGYLYADATGGSANTGGGGGGQGYGPGRPNNGAAGGKGIVIIRYKYQ